ncbi:DUF742 domain-containing protein [Streptomyces sp. NBC_00690]|uniref:DUF742 domain-containing protein n=1 Tax=Streptomyces sp. NBC_00690 TaxID=2975808 RepID=UPI002E29F86A|nr:DUF742 domain-containing protein [Streptomyces sp. NBC_00690]
MLLRGWLDAAGMRVDDLLDLWGPDHFTDGRVPAKSTVSQRLAGVGLRQDFIEAVADACSRDATGRAQLLQEVKDLKERCVSGEFISGPAREESASELVRVQQRSLELSDKLMRAMERAAELEQERSSANHLVLLLLTMVDGLQRNISALTRERDRLRTSVPEQTAQMRERLRRSEQQRTTAESELERARSERHKADRLAETAAEQVRALTQELELLRGKRASASGVPPTHYREVFDTPADDIDVALLKAARHLDDGADRLERLADELHLDNPSTSGNFSNNSDEAVARATVEEIESRLAEGVDIADFLSKTAHELRPMDVLVTVDALRNVGHDAEADLLLIAAGTVRSPTDMPFLIAQLRTDERHGDAGQLITAVGRSRDTDEVLLVVSSLREAGSESDAYQVLAAVGRIRLLAEVPPILAAANHQDADWILKIALRERPRHDIAYLHRALKALGTATEHLLHHTADAHQRSQEANQPADPASWSSAAMSDDEHEGEESDADTLFGTHLTQRPPLPRRPRLKHGPEAREVFPPLTADLLPVDSIVTTTDDDSRIPTLPPDVQRICRLCREPRTIIEIAKELNYPLTVTLILVRDLADAGAVSVSEPEQPKTRRRWGSMYAAAGLDGASPGSS